jgi:ribonuclease HI
MSHASSNKRELVAIHKALEAFVPIIRHSKWKSIQILTDNTTECYNINRLAEADTLYHSLRRLLTLTDTLNVKIHAAHIQGILNTEPDKISRLALRGITL